MRDSSSMSRAVQMVVNRAVHELSLEPERSLLSVLREELGLTGAKPGCGEGVCGACTVLVDGEPVRSCITPAVDVADRAVTTVEGLARDGTDAPGSAGVRRRTCHAVRLLHVRDDPGPRIPAGEEPRSRRDPDPRVAGGEHLPLLHVSTDRASCSPRRRARVERRRRGGHGAARRHTRAAGPRPRTVGPARSRGTRLLRRALRRDGRRAVRRAGRGWRVVDQQRRVDPRRRGRARHGVHRQGRRRAGQPHRPVATGRGGAACAVRPRPAGDG